MARKPSKVVKSLAAIGEVIDAIETHTGVVTAPVLEGTAIAVIGDNSIHASDPLPTPEALHAAFEAAVAVVAKHGAAMEHAQQRVAYLMLQRQAVRIANGETTVSLAACVSNQELRRAYLGELTDEYAGTAISTRKATDATQMVRGLSRQTFKARVDRALTLASAIAANAGDYVDFDHDKGRFRVKPKLFVAHGYIASQELRFMPESLAEGMTPVEREYVYLADDDTTQSYYCNKPGLAQIPINLSIRQYLHATGTRLEAAAKAEKGETAPPAEANAGRQQRQAQQASGRSELERKQAEADKAKREAAQLKADMLAAQTKASNLNSEVLDAKASEQTAIESDPAMDGDTPPPDSDNAKQTEWLIASLNARLVGVGYLLNHDMIHNVTAEHITPDARVAIDMLAIFLARIMVPATDKQAVA
jgi:hypothetical protein